MIQRKSCKNYSSRSKHVRGSGFMDIIKSFGSYIGQNKYLIAKPVLAATGEVAGYALNKGGKALMNKILSKQPANQDIMDKILSKEPVNQDIMNKILSKKYSPVENIIGSGIKKF